MDRNGLGDLDITQSELSQITKAFRNEEFKKLFAEYCQEISDPENRKIYERELTQLESEHGIDVTFINPEPGYVIKTTVDGTQKAFINVCKCDKVGKPTSSSGIDSSGGRGLNWNIPYTQSPSRRDMDKNGKMCIVYDVVFHGDTLHLAEKNEGFKKMVTDTACDAVSSTNGVQLDLANLKYPKMTFKGTARPTVIRKKSEHSPKTSDFSPIDSIYPPLKVNQVPQKTSNTKTATFVDKYTTPKFTITHRRNVDMQELTNELDAKMNLTVPAELVVTIELPLINSTNDVTLDVTPRNLYLSSEKPAKYKLEIALPYGVDEADGTAKFNKSTRQLVVTLPVVPKNNITISDLNREDSGVDSDHTSPKNCNSTGSEDESTALSLDCVS